MEAAQIAKNARRLRLGQELTQAEVAERSEISLPTYSKIEAGKGFPRIDTLYKVASALGVGINELLMQVRELKTVRFRAQKKMKRRDHVLAKVANWLDDFNFLIREVDPDSRYTLSEIPRKLGRISSDKKPVEAARFARETMKLDAKEPIHDIAGLLGANGIKVLAYELASDAFFGMSIGESDGGPAIIVNRWSKIPVERWIFSAAHELGHLLLHLNAYDVDVMKEDKEEEKEANVFAAEFLMPQEGFDSEWRETRGLPTWQRVLKVKRIFHVSDKVIFSRLLQLGLVNDDIWRRRNRLVKRVYNTIHPSKYEPERLKSYDFVTDWLDRLVRLAYEEKVISRSRASEFLNISLDDMRQLANSWAEGESVGKAL